ncbi:hypothetical protein [Streptomyces sp. CBMA123]|nr:hypothetical protein [Streptomyces sp. CBMA123]
MLHTVCTVAIPRKLQGRYQVAVTRDGEQAEEPLDLAMERENVVRC